MRLKGIIKTVLCAFVTILLVSAVFPGIIKKAPAEGNAAPEVQGAPEEEIYIANVNLSDLPAPEETGRAYVAFTFDDGYSSDYYLAYGILKKYGIHGTSYIIPMYQDENVPYTLTWDEIREMRSYGWDFGCHTYAHSDLTKLSAEQIRESMEKVNESFERQGLSAPVIGAYPFGRYNESVVEAVKPYRLQERKAYYETKLVDLNDVNPYEIDSVSADMRSEKRLFLHEAAVDEACRQGKALVFRCHCLYKESVNDMGEWPVQTDSRLFERLVRYCVGRGCKFITMTQLMEMYSK